MTDIEELEKAVEEKKQQELEIFQKKEQPVIEVKETDQNKQLVEGMFNQAIKFAEGELSAEEYEPMKIQRQAWRDEINELEENLKNCT